MLGEVRELRAVRGVAVQAEGEEGEEALLLRILDVQDRDGDAVFESETGKEVRGRGEVDGEGEEERDEHGGSRWVETEPGSARLSPGGEFTARRNPWDVAATAGTPESRLISSRGIHGAG